MLEWPRKTHRAVRIWSIHTKSAQRLVLLAHKVLAQFMESGALLAQAHTIMIKHLPSWGKCERVSTLVCQIAIFHMYMCYVHIPYSGLFSWVEIS